MFSGNFLHKPHHTLISDFILLDPTRIKLAMFLLTSEKQDQELVILLLLIYINTMSGNWWSCTLDQILLQVPSGIISIT